MKRSALIILAVVALAGGGLGAWHWQTRPTPVTTAIAHIGPAADLVYATGYVEAQQPASVSSRITAPVLRILAQEGDHVARGQVLAVLAADEQSAALAQSAAQTRAAAQTEARTLALYKDGWVTRAARDDAVANADAARAAQGSAAARLGQLQVRAETDGVVIRRDVYPGDLAVPGKVLFQLGDPAKTRITATVDERDIPRVIAGQTALMSTDAYPGQTIPATVAEITPGGDPTARAFRVRLITGALPTGLHMLPMGLTLEINIITHRNDHAVLVPPAAIVAGRVWVVAQGHAQPRAVITGIVGPDAVEIRKGLSAGEVVILNAAPSLRPGAAVEPKR